MILPLLFVVLMVCAAFGAGVLWRDWYLHRFARDPWDELALQARTLERRRDWR